MCRGFNEEPELPRKVAAFWRHWPCVEGEELSTWLLCEVITEALHLKDPLKRSHQMK